MSMLPAGPHTIHTSIPSSSPHTQSPSTQFAHSDSLSAPPSQAPPNSRHFSIADLHLGRVVGVGSYSEVRIAQETDTGAVLALKQMEKGKLLARKAVKRVHEEREILSKVNHQLVITFKGAFQDQAYLYLLTDFVPGGELYSLLTQKGHLSTTETRFYAAEIAVALSYLHSEDILHRDLKAENVLIAASGHIKLTDFGCAKRLKQGEKTFSLVGTPHYLAPEIIQRSGHTFAADWWALGILLYELLLGVSPFEAATPYELYTKIISKQPSFPKDLDCAALDLVSGLLRKSPVDRYGEKEVFGHPFFQGLDWDTMDQWTPPLVPALKDSLDTHHFEEFEASSETTTSVPNSVFAGF